VTHDYYEIELSLPKPPTLNTFYAGKHWAIRKKRKADYNTYIEKALSNYDKWNMESFALDIRYNCNYDVDNAIIAAKFVSDYLTANGYIPKDTPNYFTSQRTSFDKSLQKGEFLVIIKCRMLTFQ